MVLIIVVPSIACLLVHCQSGSISSILFIFYLPILHVQFNLLPHFFMIPMRMCSFCATAPCIQTLYNSMNFLKSFPWSMLSGSLSCAVVVVMNSGISSDQWGSRCLQVEAVNYVIWVRQVWLAPAACSVCSSTCLCWTWLCISPVEW